MITADAGVRPLGVIRKVMTLVHEHGCVVCGVVGGGFVRVADDFDVVLAVGAGVGLG